MKQNIKVGITHGDYNGVGYEVILKALENPMMVEICTPVIYGSGKIASFYRKQLDLPGLQLQPIKDADQAKAGQVSIVNVIGDDVKIEPGIASEAAGEAAVAALEQATADLMEGKIDVLVTAPINKHTIHGEKFNFPGHTEYLQERFSAAANGEDGEERKAMMILFNEHMRVALATVHLPLSDVSAAITRESLTDCLISLDHTLRSDFGIVRPRIAVLSLNPHSGDGGLLGGEEAEVIIPAIEDANARKVLCFGPYAADGFFGSGNFSRFDAVLAMYHDQGLTPLKTLSMDGGVNFTAGLDYVRTSPDHGTAYDIAGKGLASADSMRAAIYAAIDIYNHRQLYNEMTANPLQRQYVERSKNDNVVLDLSKSSDE